MIRAASKRNVLVNFYLPCAVSGLLLAGLIAVTTPKDLATGDVSVGLVSSQSMIALHD